MLRVLTESRIEFHRHTNSAKTFFIFSVVENLNSFADSRDFRKLIEKTVLGAVLVELHALNNLTVERTKTVKDGKGRQFDSRNKSHCMASRSRKINQMQCTFLQNKYVTEVGPWKVAPCTDTMNKEE